MDATERIRWRWAVRVGAAALVGAVALLAETGARAEDPATLPRHADQLRAANAALDERQARALLELYVLQSRVGRAERRAADLRARLGALSRQRVSAAKSLRVTRSALGKAEGQLAERLRTLYMEEDVDPVAVLLGSSSFDDAISALDSLRRLADSDRRIVSQVRGTRDSLRSVLSALAARERELRVLVARSEAAADSLEQARAEQEAYLASLAQERDLNEREIRELSGRAAAIEAKAVELAAQAAVASAPTDDGESPPPRGTPAPVGALALSAGGPDPPPVGGTTLTVVATGYVLGGTTATGLPVQLGVVAVDPAVIPLGARLNVPGYGDAVAADIGSAVHGATIDLWFPTLAQALAWGRRTVTISLR